MSETKPIPPATEEPDGNEPARVTFSLPQLLGGAAAASTAAFLGSLFGTAGTIIGAALASVVGAIAGTVYTAGLDRTGRRVSTVMKRGWERVRGADPSAEVEGEGLELVVEQHDPGTMAPVPTGPVRTPQQRARTWRAVGLRVLLAAVGIFAVTFAVITVLELTTGQALGGKPGTTVGQVTRPEPEPSSDEPEPSETPTPSATPSESATPTPTPTPSVTPTPTPTVTTVEPSPAPTTAPTTSAEPPASPSASDAATADSAADEAP